MLLRLGYVLDICVAFSVKTMQAREWNLPRAVVCRTPDKGLDKIWTSDWGGNRSEDEVFGEEHLYWTAAGLLEPHITYNQSHFRNADEDFEALVIRSMSRMNFPFEYTYMTCLLS